MRVLFCCTLSMIITLSFGQADENITLTRTPAISPDGKTVAFSYQGDIWSMNIGEAPRRLTIHEAYESEPVFSPDGQSIAFTSRRFGNDDVYKIALEGGAAERLTFHSASDRPSDWTEDGDILFGTRRAFAQIEWDDEVYSIGANGGTPSRLLDALGGMATASPNGKWIAFVRGSCRISREQYNGPADQEIWLYNTESKEYSQLTDNENNDYLPKWGSNADLYYLSAASGRYNIVKAALENGKLTSTTPVTNYTDEGLRHYDVNGGAFVFEKGSGLYHLPREGATPLQLHLNIRADYRFDPVRSKTYSDNISSYSISPNGKAQAMTIHGEVFVKELDKEISRSHNVSEHPYREGSTVWLNDSSLVFSSDRNGQYDLFMARSGDDSKSDLTKTLKYELVRITNTPEDEESPLISPDGKKICFYRNGSELIVADIDEKGKISGEKTLHEGWNSPGSVSWSPCSRWLAYSLSDLNFNRDIYIQAIDGNSSPVNVSMHPRGDYGTFWSEDGSKLGFLSNRNGGNTDVWFVWLKRDDWLKTKEEWKEGNYFDDDDKEDKKGKKDKKDKDDDEKEDEGVEPIQIDIENIHDRLVQVTSEPGDEGGLVISKDGEYFYYTSQNRSLNKVKWDGSDKEQLLKPGKSARGLSLDPSGDDLYAVMSGKVTKIDHKKGSTTPMPHKATMKIDRMEEREQVFEEAWSILSENFYDPDFHGKDWSALKDQYKPLAMAASTTQDFRYIFNLMLGQLNASHLGIYGSNPEKTQSESTGRIGIEVKPLKKGVEVTHVVPFTSADYGKSKLMKGDVIMEVNGVEVGSNVNFYSLFSNEKGNQVLLRVKRDGDELDLAIRPQSSISTALYEEWIRDKRALVDRYSKGRLGYIHIRGMDMGSFERFERELMASGMGKEGIVIDVRFNGGGWTTDYLMAVLNVRQHAYTIPRGAAKNLEKDNKKFQDYYPYSERLPLSSWTKPSIAMCNQSSYSNAEIFSHAYKNLGIGTLVGMPTFGAVISTGGRSLMDGSFVRMPFRAWYVRKDGMNMENGPAVPDILIENEPDSRSKGEDQQLEKAVQELLGQIDAQ